MEKSVCNNNRQLISPNGGFVMVEAVIGVVLASILLTAFLSLNVEATKLNCANVNNFKADMYLKELIEVAKDLEQSEQPVWIELNKSCLSGCYPKIINNKWELSSGSESLNSGMFTRSLTIEDVCRDNYQTDHFEFPNNIVECIIPSNIDPETKKITAHIEWNDGTLHKMELETYVYNY